MSGLDEGSCSSPVLVSSSGFNEQSSGTCSMALQQREAALASDGALSRRQVPAKETPSCSLLLPTTWFPYARRRPVFRGIWGFCFCFLLRFFPRLCSCVVLISLFSPKPSLQIKLSIIKKGMSLKTGVFPC